MRPALRAGTALLVAVLLASCGGGGGDPTGGTGNNPGGGGGVTPTIVLAVAPTSGTVAQGGTAIFAASATQSNVTGGVTLALEGLPAGVTASVSNTNVTLAVTTTTWQVSVAGSVAAGSYPITVRARATGVADATSSYTLTVTTAAPAGSYTLAVSPTSATIAQGGTTTTAVTLTRTNFTGSVNLSVAGLPAGLTASFAPNNTTGSASVLTLTSTAAVAPGVYTLAVGGVAAGQPDKVAIFTLTVTASSGGGGGGGGTGNVTANFSFCPATSKPIWVAYQDGAGAWTRVTGTGDVYAFTVAGTRGGLVWVTQSGPSNTLLIGQYYARSEMTAAPLVFCSATPTKTLSAIVAGLGATDVATVSIGTASMIATSAAPALTLARVLDGAQDVVGYRQSSTTPFTGDRLFLRRDVNLPSGGALGTLDFNGAESVAPASATFTLANASGEQIARGMSYYTGASCAPGTLYQAALSSSTSFPMFGAPAAVQRSTDYHVASFTAIGATVTRTVLESFRTLAARTVALPTTPTNVAVTALTGPYKRLQTSFTIPAEYQAMGLAYYDAGAAHYVSLGATLASLGSTAGVLAMPDLSAVSGWNAAWVPATAAAVSVVSSATGSAGNTCSEGARVVSVQVSGTN